MIKPTLGRVVWYTNEKQEQHTALVCYVWNDTCVNLACFDGDGVPYARTSVLLFHGEEGEVRPEGLFCEWMPYQKVQAEKHAAEDLKTDPVV